jgi:hypothetical protein
VTHIYNVSCIAIGGKKLFCVRGVKADVHASMSSLDGLGVVYISLLIQISVYFLICVVFILHGTKTNEELQLLMCTFRRDARCLTPMKDCQYILLQNTDWCV